jgi:hypothetical protein
LWLKTTLEQSQVLFQELEANLMHAVKSLQQRKHIHGTAPKLKDLLNPIEETEISRLDY